MAASQEPQPTEIFYIGTLLSANSQTPSVHHLKFTQAIYVSEIRVLGSEDVSGLLNGTKCETQSERLRLEVYAMDLNAACSSDRSRFDQLCTIRYRGEGRTELSESIHLDVPTERLVFRGMFTSVTVAVLGVRAALASDPAINDEKQIRILSNLALMVEQRGGVVQPLVPTLTLPQTKSALMSQFPVSAAPTPVQVTGDDDDDENNGNDDDDGSSSEESESDSISASDSVLENDGSDEEFHIKPDKFNTLTDILYKFESSPVDIEPLRAALAEPDLFDCMEKVHGLLKISRTSLANVDSDVIDSLSKRCVLGINHDYVTNHLYKTQCQQRYKVRLWRLTCQTIRFLFDRDSATRLQSHLLEACKIHSRLMNLFECENVSSTVAIDVLDALQSIVASSRSGLKALVSVYDRLVTVATRLKRWRIILSIDQLLSKIGFLIEIVLVMSGEVELPTTTTTTTTTFPISKIIKNLRFLGECDLIGSYLSLLHNSTELLTPLLSQLLFDLRTPLHSALLNLFAGKSWLTKLIGELKNKDIHDLLTYGLSVLYLLASPNLAEMKDIWFVCEECPKWIIGRILSDEYVFSKILAMEPSSVFQTDIILTALENMPPHNFGQSLLKNVSILRKLANKKIQKWIVLLEYGDGDLVRRSILAAERWTEQWPGNVSRICDPSRLITPLRYLCWAVSRNPDDDDDKCERAAILAQMSTFLMDNFVELMHSVSSVLSTSVPMNVQKRKMIALTLWPGLELLEKLLKLIVEVRGGGGDQFKNPKPIRAYVGLMSVLHWIPDERSLLQDSIVRGILTYTASETGRNLLLRELIESSLSSPRLYIGGLFLIREALSSGGVPQHIPDLEYLLTNLCATSNQRICDLVTHIVDIVGENSECMRKMCRSMVERAVSNDSAQVLNFLSQYSRHNGQFCECLRDEIRASSDYQSFFTENVPKNARTTAALSLLSFLFEREGNVPAVIVNALAEPINVSSATNVQQPNKISNADLLREYDAATSAACDVDRRMFRARQGRKRDKKTNTSSITTSTGAHERYVAPMRGFGYNRRNRALIQNTGIRSMMTAAFNDSVIRSNRIPKVNEHKRRE